MPAVRQLVADEPFRDQVGNQGDFESALLALLQPPLHSSLSARKPQSPTTPRPASQPRRPRTAVAAVETRATTLPLIGPSNQFTAYQRIDFGVTSEGEEKQEVWST